jgi:putative ABC transport system ATP-binding protein
MDAGELVVVRGRSGSGKSTLLALIVGWCAPDGGSVSVLVHDSPDAGRSLWSTVAIVPQVLGLVPELTVRENVAQALTGTDESVDDVLAALDIVELGDRSPTDTSMGQQQRVAVARAIAGRPHVLLADEPTSHQDAHHVAGVVAALRSAADAGSAVLVATHDDSIIAAANRVVDLTIDGGH